MMVAASFSKVASGRRSASGIWPSPYSCSVRTSTRIMASSESNFSFARSGDILPPFSIGMSSDDSDASLSMVVSEFTASVSVSTLDDVQAVSHISVNSIISAAMVIFFMRILACDGLCFIGTPPDVNVL